MKNTSQPPLQSTVISGHMLQVENSFFDMPPDEVTNSLKTKPSLRANFSCARCASARTAVVIEILLCRQWQSSSALPVSSTPSTVLLLLSRASITGVLRQSSFLLPPRLRASRGRSFFWPLKDSRKNVLSSSMISPSLFDWLSLRSFRKRCCQLNDVFRVIPLALAIGRKVVDCVMLSRYRFHFSGC